MPLNKLVLIALMVMIAAGVTVWVGTMAAAALQFGERAWAIFIPAALVAYVVWRVIADRIGNAKDDHYDHIKK